MIPEHAAYALRAEVRAVEDGHHAFLLDDGRYRVVSSTDDDVAYEVTPMGASQPGGLIVFACTCPSGAYRAGRIHVPCKHAALVARRLEREGAAVWEDGGWRRAREVSAPPAPAPDLDRIVAQTRLFAGPKVQL